MFLAPVMVPAWLGTCAWKAAKPLEVTEFGAKLLP